MTLQRPYKQKIVSLLKDLCMKFFHCFLLLFVPLMGLGQQSVIDSLHQELGKVVEENRSKILNELCFKKILIGDFEDALKYANEAYHHSIQFNNSKEEALALKHLGIIHYFKNDYEKALINYEQSAALFEKNENYDDLIKVLHNVSNLYLKKETFRRFWNT